MKFRKKPVVIDAFLYMGIGQAKHLDLFFGEFKEWMFLQDDRVQIRTLEGDMIANQGDYIIKGVKGEFYPCKPEIFEATYERAE